MVMRCIKPTNEYYNAWQQARVQTQSPLYSAQVHQEAATELVDNQTQHKHPMGPSKQKQKTTRFQHGSRLTEIQHYDPREQGDKLAWKGACKWYQSAKQQKKWWQHYCHNGKTQSRRFPPWVLKTDIKKALDIAYNTFLQVYDPFLFFLCYSIAWIHWVLGFA